MGNTKPALEVLQMSLRERQRLIAFQSVKQKQSSQKAAAEIVRNCHLPYGRTLSFLIHSELQRFYLCYG